MPRKRTIGKRRMGPQEGAQAWQDVFLGGAAIFDDFTDETGVDTDRHGKVAESAAWAAWQAYGAIFLSFHGRERRDGRPLWALEQFGEPYAN